MSEEFKDFTTAPTPTLTLEPTLDTQEPLVAQEEAKPVPPAEEDVLSAEEKKMVEDFSKQINVRDSNMILQYGAGAQKKMVKWAI